MDLMNTPVVSMLKRSMSWLKDRQSVLSENVANADTPNYTPSDLKKIDFEQELRSSAAPTGTGLAMTKTNAMHMSAPQMAPLSKIESPDKEADPTGNSVSLEEEMIKVADTQAQYQQASNLYGKTLTMMKSAIGSS